MDNLEAAKNFLVIGYGNTLCGDDGLGPKVIEMLIPRLSPNVSRVTDFLVLHQLDVVLCARLNNYRHIIFVDVQTDLWQNDAVIIELSKENEDIIPAEQPDFSAHAVSPWDLLALTRQIYSDCPYGWLVAVRGFQTELGTGLSEEAMKNADKAVDSIIRHLDSLTAEGFASRR